MATNRSEKRAEETSVHIDEQGEELSTGEWIEYLESVIADSRIKLNAARDDEARKRG